MTFLSAYMHRMPFALVVLCMAAPLFAQNYPSRPIRMIVPFSPGGATDVPARIVAQRLSEALGQQVVIDNRPGAGSMLGAEVVAKANPDGYTLLLTATTHVISASLYKKVPYDAVRDFAPVMLVGSGPNVLAIHPSLPAKSVRDVIQLAKSKPGAITFASVGPGSPARLLLEWFKLKTGVNVVNVPYKGAGNAIIELISGQVDAMF